MAGNNNNNNNKNRQNYFTQNIQRMGENFLEWKTSRDVYYESQNIFRQLSRKQIDLERYGHFFLERNFLENCIEAANQRMIFHHISYNGIFCMLQTPGMQIHPKTQEVAETHRRSAMAYEAIYVHLSQMRDTGNINFLYMLVNVLSSPAMKGAL